MHKEAREELEVMLKFVVLELANYFSVTMICQEFNLPHSSFYCWKQKYDKEGRVGLHRKKPIANSHSRKTHPDVVEKI
jgi:hypothetical protein